MYFPLCEIAKGCCEPPLGRDANFSRSIITLNASVDVEKNIRCTKFASSNVRANGQTMESNNEQKSIVDQTYIT